MDIKEVKRIMKDFDEATQKTVLEKLKKKAIVNNAQNHSISNKANRNRSRPIPKHFINMTIKLGDFFTDRQKKKFKNSLSQRAPESEIPIILNAANETPKPYRGDEVGDFTLHELNSIKQINQKYDTSTEEGQQKAFREYPESIKRKVTARVKTRLDPAYTKHSAYKEQEYLPIEDVIPLSQSEREAIKHANSIYNLNSEEGMAKAFAHYPKRVKNLITAPIWKNSGYQDRTPIIRTKRGDY